MRARTEIGWKQNAKCEIFLFQEGGMDTEAAADIWANRNRAHTRIDPLLSIAADGCATKKMTLPRRLCPESKREFRNFSRFSFFFPELAREVSRSFEFFCLFRSLFISIKFYRARQKSCITETGIWNMSLCKGGKKRISISKPMRFSVLGMGRWSTQRRFIKISPAASRTMNPGARRSPRRKLKRYVSFVSRNSRLDESLPVP